MKGALHFLLHRASGLVLFAGLATHAYVMHIMGAGAITHATVMARLADPLWVAFNAAFALSCFYHGLRGVQGVALEYIHSPSGQRAARVCIALAAVGMGALAVRILALG
jgi:succinate dehydrogenase hydrophobic anchor subunit